MHTNPLLLISADLWAPALRGAVRMLWLRPGGVFPWFFQMDYFGLTHVDSIWVNFITTEACSPSL